MAKRPKIMMRVVKGGLQPADQYSTERLRAKNYKIGEIVSVEVVKCRNPGFHRLAHQIGALVAQNIEGFEGMPAHMVLKRLQIESGLECDEMAIEMPGIGGVLQRIPRSLSFDSMDDVAFHEFVAGICRHIAKQYWPSLDADQIEEMAELMVD